MSNLPGSPWMQFASVCGFLPRAILCLAPLFFLQTVLLGFNSFLTA